MMFSFRCNAALILQSLRNYREAFDLELEVPSAVTLMSHLMVASCLLQHAHSF